MKQLLLLSLCFLSQVLFCQSISYPEKISSNRWTIGNEAVQLEMYRFNSIVAAKQYVDNELMKLSIGGNELMNSNKNTYYIFQKNDKVLLRVRQGRFYTKIYSEKRKTAFDVAIVFLSSLPDYVPPPSILSTASYVFSSKEKEANRLDTIPPPLPPPPPPPEPAVEEIFRVIERIPTFSTKCDSLKDNTLIIDCLKKRVEKQLLELIKYPKVIKEKKITGSIVVSYIIEKNGELRDIKILKDAEGYFGAAIKTALSKVDLQQKWQPPNPRGRSVRIQMIQEIKLPH